MRTMPHPPFTTTSYVLVDSTFVNDKAMSPNGSKTLRASRLCIGFVMFPKDDLLSRTIYTVRHASTTTAA